MPSYFTSLTMPTTVAQGQVVQPPERKRLPTALSLGKKRRAHALSTTTHSSACCFNCSCKSRSSSSRPSRSFRPSVRMKVGETATHGVTACDRPGPAGYCSRSKLLCCPAVLGGNPSDVATEDTPGSAATLRSSSSQNARMRSLLLYCAPGRRIEPVSTCPASTPTSTWRKRSRLVSNNAAIISSGVAIANCAATKPRRNRRTPAPPATVLPERSDASTDPPVACAAGTRPKINALDTASAAINHIIEIGRAHV